MSATYSAHHEETIRVPADAMAVFAFVDDHANLSGHMNKKNAMTAGGSFRTEIDDGHAQKLGSHVRMSGRVLGVPLSLDEVVIEREEPAHKAWETVGEPHLLVVGPYRMAFDITPRDANASDLRVSIDYAQPTKNTWLGKLFGKTYARWCVRQMTGDVQKHFANGA